MSKHYRIIFECYESTPEEQGVLSKTTVMSGVIEKPADVFNFGLAHEEQVKLIYSCQEVVSQKDGLEDKVA